MNEEILHYYNSSGIESFRLERNSSQLEKLRTQLIIERFLGKSPLKILDAGGGAGVYSFWLKEKGHEVHLLDPSSVNLEYARTKADENGIHLDAIVEGLAEDLPYEEDNFDAVLFLGPLYHLIERDERIKAIAEAKRVLKKGGLFFAAAINRYASLFDGFMRNLVADPAFVSILQQDLKNGQHRNETDNFQYFTTAFFHHPKELKEELSDSGFNEIKIFPVESFGWLVPDFEEKWKDEKFRELVLKTINTVEEDEMLLGVSAHLIGVGVKPS